MLQSIQFPDSLVGIIHWYFVMGSNVILVLCFQGTTSPEICESVSTITNGRVLGSIIMLLLISLPLTLVLSAVCVLCNALFRLCTGQTLVLEANPFYWVLHICVGEQLVIVAFLVPYVISPYLAGVLTLVVYIPLMGSNSREFWSYLLLSYFFMLSYRDFSVSLSPWQCISFPWRMVFAYCREVLHLIF